MWVFWFKFTIPLFVNHVLGITSLALRDSPSLYLPPPSSKFAPTLPSVVNNNTALCFCRYRWIFVAALLPLQGVRLAWRSSVRCFSILLSLLLYEQYDQGWSIGGEWITFTSGSGVWANGELVWFGLADMSLVLPNHSPMMSLFDSIVSFIHPVDEKPTCFLFKYIFSLPLFHFIFTISSGVFQLTCPILSDIFLFFNNHPSLPYLPTGLDLVSLASLHCGAVGAN